MGKTHLTSSNGRFFLCNVQVGTLAQPSQISVRGVALAGRCSYSSGRVSASQRHTVLLQGRGGLAGAAAAGWGVRESSFSVLPGEHIEVQRQGRTLLCTVVGTWKNFLSLFL